MKRYACNNPAGPTNLSGFHQNDGHAVVQQPHKMHSDKPFRCARCSGDCRRSVSGGGSLLIKYGLIEWYCLKNCVMSTIRSRITGNPGNGRNVTGSFRDYSGDTASRPVLPWMFSASEPHTPSRHDLRNDRLSSCSLINSSASSNIFPCELS